DPLLQIDLILADCGKHVRLSVYSKHMIVFGVNLAIHSKALMQQYGPSCILFLAVRFESASAAAHIVVNQTSLTHICSILQAQNKVLAFVILWRGGGMKIKMAG